MLFAILPLAVTPVAAHTEEGAFKIDLIAGQHTDVGDILVWGDSNHVYIRIITTGNWKITELHIDVATDCTLIPQTRSGNPIPGQFQYKHTFSPSVSETPIITIDLAGNEINAQTLCVAVHAVVVQTCQGAVWNQQTAWGNGHDFPGANWGMCFT